MAKAKGKARTPAQIEKLYLSRTFGLLDDVEVNTYPNDDSQTTAELVAPGFTAGFTSFSKREALQELWDHIDRAFPARTVQERVRAAYKRGYRKGHDDGFNEGVCK